MSEQETNRIHKHPEAAAENAALDHGIESNTASAKPAEAAVYATKLFNRRIEELTGLEYEKETGTDSEHIKKTLVNESMR